MSLFSWFKSTPQTPRSHEKTARSAGNPRDPASPKTAGVQAAETAAEIAERRKDERSRLRELLYNVVRESMVRVGVLSSSFKFKVLATDPKGRKFIVMMDLSRDFGSEISQLAEIETLICQAAKTRYNIVVSSVYWRAEDPVAGSQADGAHPGAKYRATVPTTPALAEANATAAGVAATAAKSKFEPVLADEISALKRALASGNTAGSATDPPSGTPQAPKNYTLLTGYENTEFIESEQPENEAVETQLLDDEVRYPALSPTQYGDLR